MNIFKDGFAMDAPVGIHAEVFVILFMLAHRLQGKVNVQGTLPAMIVGFLASVTAHMVFFGLTGIFDQTYTGFSNMLPGMLPNALVTAPFAPIVFFLYSRSNAVLARKRRENVFFR